MLDSSKIVAVEELIDVLAFHAAMQIPLNLETERKTSALKLAETDGAEFHAAEPNVSSAPQNVLFLGIPTRDQPRASSTGIEELADDLVATITGGGELVVDFFGNELHRAKEWSKVY